MIPLVTVTYTKDKWQMLLQAHSIEKYAIEPTTHYVIINDDQTSFLEWKCLLHPIYKRNTLVLISKYNSPKLFEPNNLSVMGSRPYQRQMILKLTIAKLIKHPYYIVLDSKNILFKPTNFNIFDNSEGCGSFLNIEAECVQYYFETIKKAHAELNLPIPEEFWFVGTPFVFKTEIILNMLNVVDIYRFVYEIINNKGNFSEFILYNMFSKTTRETKNWVSAYYLSETIEQCLDRFKKFDTFIIYRMSLKNFLHRNNLKKLLLEWNLDEKYVIPALYLTSPTDR